MVVGYSSGVFCRSAGSTRKYHATATITPTSVAVPNSGHFHFTVNTGRPEYSACQANTIAHSTIPQKNSTASAYQTGYGRFVQSASRGAHSTALASEARIADFRT